MIFLNKLILLFSRDDSQDIYNVIQYFIRFDPYNVFLAVATNIPVILMTGFVLQDPIISGKYCQL